MVAPLPLSASAGAILKTDPAIASAVPSVLASINLEVVTWECPCVNGYRAAIFGRDRCAQRGSLLTLSDLLYSYRLGTGPSLTEAVSFRSAKRH
jgi:hypothetical protein